MTAKLIEEVFGPRAPADVTQEERQRYRLPTYLLAGAAILLIISIFLPYWQMTLLAPQYPGGLSFQTYVNRLTGDVAEIDGLNHYIGMRPLDEAAQLERSLSIFAISVLALLLVAAIFVHSKWVVLLALPAMLFPIIFMADMYFWMANFGLNLDQTAALSGAIDPFVPPILGTGAIAQFKTVATLQPGMWLALLASVLILAGLYFHRAAYKPLVDQRKDTANGA